MDISRKLKGRHPRAIAGVAERTKQREWQFYRYVPTQCIVKASFVANGDLVAKTDEG